MTVLLDLLAYRAHSWATWHVFAYAFAVYLLGIMAVVFHCSLDGLCANAVFGAALLASISVAGIGYQQVREAGGFRKTDWQRFADDERGW